MIAKSSVACRLPFRSRENTELTLARPGFDVEGAASNQSLLLPGQTHYNLTHPEAARLPGESPRIAPCYLVKLWGHRRGTVGLVGPLGKLLLVSLTRLLLDLPSERFRAMYSFH
jgi:hypothetical protein